MMHDFTNEKQPYDINKIEASFGDTIIIFYSGACDVFGVVGKAETLFSRVGIQAPASKIAFRHA